ncbi:MAG: 16S rRNA (cytosine(1402)-N(4))-methyltransferase RsmH [Candidatus Omnitrophota bacterium]
MTHIPVMTKEVLENLNLKAGSFVLDCTLGTAGHALEILKRIGPHGRYIGTDRDGESLSVAQDRLKDFAGQCHFEQTDFRDFDVVLNKLGIREVDAILLDVGISSYQIDNPQRGFSLRSDGPLDMRMDKNSYISAYDLVNSLSEKEIASILKNFGEERWHHRIASFLVRERSKNPIASTGDLSRVVLRAIPRGAGKQKIHPATRTFQAFRIAVNRELEALEVALDKSINYLKVGGRTCVISFHSLEDRIAKEKFKEFSQKGLGRIITKTPLRPSDEENAVNSRARSARLRVIERTK